MQHDQGALVLVCPGRRIGERIHYPHLTILKFGDNHVSRLAGGFNQYTVCPNMVWICPVSHNDAIRINHKWIRRVIHHSCSNGCKRAIRVRIVQGNRIFYHSTNYRLWCDVVSRAKDVPVMQYKQSTLVLFCLSSGMVERIFYPHGTFLKF